jgi:hypothetical protein
MDIIELFIDENEAEDGISAISFVNQPAIEENFVALSQQKVEFKAVDDDKRIVVGLALVPDKHIYRRKGDYEYKIVFSKDTVKKASHLYLKQLNNNNATLEHREDAEGISVVESWIVEDVKNDKSNLYNLNVVEGAWVVVMKVENDEIWKDVKDGTYLGLSIEGVFSDKQVKTSKEKIEEAKEEVLEEVGMTEEELIDAIIKMLEETDLD